MTKKIAVLPGDGIGQEIVAEAVKVIACLQNDFGLNVELEEALVGGAAYDDSGSPLPESTMQLASDADAVLLGAVGGYKWEVAKAKAHWIYNPRFITAHLYPPIYNRLVPSCVPWPSLIRGPALPSVGQAET